MQSSFIDFISQFVTRANVTLFLSIFGAFGTLVTLISSFYAKRKRLKIKISNVQYKKDQKQMLLDIAFENRSQLPIAVTSVHVFLNNHELEVMEYPWSVNEYTHLQGGKIVDKKFLYNLEFPVTIQQLGASAGKMLLEFSPKELESPSTPLIFQVHSTRGRVQQIELPCNQIEYL